MSALRALRSLANEIKDQTLQRREHERLAARAPGLRLGRGVEVRSPERLTMGPDVTIDSFSLLHCGGMQWSAGSGGISIGGQSYVGPHCVLFGAGGIEIGCRALLSPGVVVTSHQHSFGADAAIRDQPTRFDRVTIGDDVWIGAHATVLPGVCVGAGAVIGAGSVVTADVPPRSLAIGVPARVRRSW